MVKALLTWTADVSLVLGIAVLALSVLLVPEVILVGQDTGGVELAGPCVNGCSGGCVPSDPFGCVGIGANYCERQSDPMNCGGCRCVDVDPSEQVYCRCRK
jgi:hypothetical protein